MYKYFVNLDELTRNFYFKKASQLSDKKPSPTITFESQCVACSIEMCGQIMNKDEGKNNFIDKRNRKGGQIVQ